jgi:hypothetical protein
MSSQLMISVKPADDQSPFISAANFLSARRANIAFRNLMDYAAIEQCLHASNDNSPQKFEKLAVEPQPPSDQRFVIAGQDTPSVALNFRPLLLRA